MSEWYTPESDDIEIDGDEVNILVAHNNQGNVYVTLKLEQIESMLHDLKQSLGSYRG